MRGQQGRRVTIGSRRGERYADVVGCVLVLLFAAWVAYGAARRQSTPGPVLTLLLAMTTLIVVCRWLTRRDPRLVSCITSIGITGAVVMTAPGALEAGGGPLGYANANATLAGLGALTAAGLAAPGKDRAVRSGWALLAAGLAATVVLTGSVAGIACLAVGFVLLAISEMIGRPVVAVLGGVIAVLLALGITVAIARGANPLGLGERAAERADLWGAASDLATTHPLRGIGLGGFVDANSVSSDADLRWAHHDFLQLAAESGLVGLGLVLTLLGWAYVRLGLAAVSDGPRGSLGAALLTVVALHATVDHVTHTAAVPLTLAVLLGTATARRTHTPIQGSQG